MTRPLRTVKVAALVSVTIDRWEALVWRAPRATGGMVELTHAQHICVDIRREFRRPERDPVSGAAVSVQQP